MKAPILLNKICVLSIILISISCSAHAITATWNMYFYANDGHKISNVNFVTKQSDFMNFNKTVYSPCLYGVQEASPIDGNSYHCKLGGAANITVEEGDSGNPVYGTLTIKSTYEKTANNSFSYSDVWGYIYHSWTNEWHMGSADNINNFKPACITCKGLDLITRGDLSIIYDQEQYKCSNVGIGAWYGSTWDSFIIGQENQMGFASSVDNLRKFDLTCVNSATNTPALIQITGKGHRQFRVINVENL
ncbi:hypothetical protein [Aquella oligotrophica]|uniref:Uncharacterized protein n=1 Tax=Aquella oligotrophica TaxID=2067065 RepID=A0A2I7N8M1_9NEIS|nr:hypothetical protein [Aquella oligotrophica]AUR52807.1 hypothetical protein CUN60_11050 [Aquella oligotrophica]